MSGQMYGADIAELERLASEFRRTAEELNNEGSILTGILNRVAWLGDIATNYVGDWTGVQIPKIGLSTQFLNDAADNLLRQAEEQRQASESGGRLGSRISAPLLGLAGGLPILAGRQLLDLADNLLRLGDLSVSWDELGKLGTNAVDLAENKFGLTVAGGGLVLNLMEKVLDAAGLDEAALFSGAGARVLDIVGSAKIFTDALTGSPVGKAAPILGAVSGLITFGGGAHDLLFDKEAHKGRAAADMVSGGLITAGSVMVMTGGLAPVGGALIVAGSVIQAGTWAHEHWGEITAAASDFTEAIDEIDDAALNLVSSGIDEAKDQMSKGLNVVKGWF